MGVDNALGMFVDDRNFVPTKRQLLRIPAILEDVGIIDAIERQRMESEIEIKYPKSNAPIIVQGKGSDKIKFKANGKRGFPFFESKFYDEDSGVAVDECRMIDEDDDEDQDVDNDADENGTSNQLLEIYKESTCMQPMSGERWTRFVIAHVNLFRLPLDTPWELTRRIAMNPVLLRLQVKLQRTLNKPVVQEVLYC